MHISGTDTNISYSSLEAEISSILDRPWVLKEVMDRDGRRVPAIMNPSSDLSRVMMDGCNIRFINDPSFEICLIAVIQNGYALWHIKNQTSQICLAAVKYNGMALTYVQNQTPEICMAAVKQCGEALMYVLNQTPQICKTAVIQNKEAVRFIYLNVYNTDMGMGMEGMGIEMFEAEISEIIGQPWTLGLKRLRGFSKYIG